MSPAPSISSSCHKNQSGVSTTFVVITDTHLSTQTDSWNDRIVIPNFDSFRRTELILQAMKEESEIDFIVHAGDVVNKGEVSQYTRFDELVCQYFPERPIYYVAGNHDREEAMRDLLRWGVVEDHMFDKNRINYHVRHGQNHFLIIDATGEKSWIATVGNEGREWLKARIDQIPKEHFVWPIIHTPVIKPLPWMADRAALTDGAEVEQIFKMSKASLKLVLHGHIHRELEYLNASGQLKYHSLCTASYPLTQPKGKDLKFDNSGKVGYEVVHLEADGSFVLTSRKVDVRESFR